MGDHTEVVRVEYDPAIISYRELLSIFWNAHDPERQSPKRQYWNAVFYHNKDQKEAAETSLEKQREKANHTIHTKILPVQSFTRAEQYHQKYYLQQNDRLMNYLKNQYARTSNLLDSTAATRANAFIAGVLDEQQLREHLDDLENTKLTDDALTQVTSLLCGSIKK